MKKFAEFALVVCLSLWIIGRASNASPPSKTEAVDISLPPLKVLFVGQNAPSFKSRDMNGIERTPGANLGKKLLLLTFFPKCFTFNCKNQLMSLRDRYGDLQKAGVEIWGVSVDPAEGARGQKAFAKHLKLQYPLIPDPQRKICLLYGTVQATNQMSARISILIDKEGKVRWIDKQVDPRHHGTEVLAKLHELQLIPESQPDLAQAK